MEPWESVSNICKELEISKDNGLHRCVKISNGHWILAPWNIHHPKKILNFYWILGSTIDSRDTIGNKINKIIAAV